MRLRFPPSPTSDFVKFRNSWARDYRLSWQARGLLVELLSHDPDVWTPSIEQLVRQATERSASRRRDGRAPRREGRDGLYAAIEELKDLGYLTATRERGGQGEMTWTFSDPRASEPDVAPTDMSEPHLAEPTHKKTTPEEDQALEKTIPQTSGGREARRLADLLADLIVENGAPKRPEVGKRWLDAIRLMIDRDGVSPSEVETAIRWAHGDSFWRGIVLSAPKLRQHYETLRLRAGTQPVGDRHVAAGRSVHEQLVREQQAAREVAGVLP